MSDFSPSDPKNWERYRHLIGSQTWRFEADPDQSEKPEGQRSGMLTSGFLPLPEGCTVDGVKAALEWILESRPLVRGDGDDLTVSVRAEKLSDFTSQFGLQGVRLTSGKEKTTVGRVKTETPLASPSGEINWARVKCYRNRNGRNYFLTCERLEESSAIQEEMKKRKIPAQVRSAGKGYLISILPSAEKAQELEAELGLQLANAPITTIARARA